MFNSKKFKYLDYSFFKTPEYKKLRLSIDLLSELEIDNLIDQELHKIFFNSNPNLSNGKFVPLISGRAALSLAFKVINLPPKSEVLMLGHTCVEVFNSITINNLTPIVVDIDVKTIGFDLLDLKNKITCNTRVIIIQHHLGLPCTDSIFEFARNNGLFIIEDCALTFGSFENNKIVGVKGDISIFSFGKSKPINCYVGGLIWVSTPYINILEKFNIPKLHFLKVFSLKLFFKLEVIVYNSDCFVYKIFLLNIFKFIFRKFGIYDHIPAINNNENPIKLLPFYFKKILLCNLNYYPNWRVKIILIKNIFIDYLKSKNLVDKLPSVYFNKSYEIVSHRIILLDYSRKVLSNILLDRCDVNKSFYKNPVDGLENSIGIKNYNYPNSISLTKRMVQIPVTNELLRLLKSTK